MASSIGSCPFLVEAYAETSVLLQTTKSNRPFRFPSFAYQPRKCAEVSIKENSENYGKLVCGRSRGLLWRNTHLRATGKSSGASGEKDGAEDVLETTIEKSKKVLAMQRDLLQQVVFHYLCCGICFTSVGIVIL